MTTPYIDPKEIFASDAPNQDKPARFDNYTKGMDETRKNNGRPTIKQSNFLQQKTDQKFLYIHERGAALPYIDGFPYEENAPVVKDGVLVQKKGNEWKPVGVNKASDILDESGLTQQEINNYIFQNTYYAEREGFISGGADNKLIWESVLAKMNHGDVLVFKSGDYHSSAPVDIYKVIRIVGQTRMRDYGTILRFPNSSGIRRLIAGIQIEYISIRGAGTSTVLDINANVFGSVGLQDIYTDTNKAGYTSLNQVLIHGFDTGRLLQQGSGEIWAGAYRENYALHIQNNRIGIVAKDGATHEKFIGGVISGNIEIGVWSEAPNSEYNNLDFIGTTIEKNGQYLNVNSRDVLKSLNIYSGKNSKVRLIGTYNESSLCIATNGGSIDKIASHEHVNSYNFASDGVVNLNLSDAGYNNKLTYISSLLSLVAATQRCTALQGDSKFAIKITSNQSGNTRFDLGKFPASTVKNKDIHNIRISFKYRFTSGFTANPELMITPIISSESTTAGRVDNTNTGAFIPLQLLRTSHNEWHTFDMYYKPRTDATNYLDPEGFLSSISVLLSITNGSIAPNFTTNNLGLDFCELSVELICKDFINLSFLPKNSGSTLERPKLSSFDSGFIYNDTDAVRNVLWNGAKWIVLFDDNSGVSFTRTTTVDLSSISNQINTTSKYASKLVFNNTDNKMYFSIGSSANSLWRATDGSVDITPT